MKKIKELYNLFLESDGVSTDTRQDIGNTIFFALSGENFNGNKFALDAIKKGALISVVDDSDYCLSDQCFLVDNVLDTLQQLARYHRKQMDVTIVAITGSNGKTTTKELISIVLSKSINIISTLGNFNNHIGVPLTLLRIKEDTELAVVEMGANHIGEIESLCEIALPDVGIITNIGKAHLEGFGSYEGVITAKNELYNYIINHQGKIIVNADDDLLMELSAKANRLTYGVNNSDIEGEIVVTHPHLQIKWAFNQEIFHCHSNLYGKYNFYNILAAMAVGCYFNIEPEFVNRAIEEYIPKNNRSQQLRTKTNNIILDAYNANPYSMAEAIISFADCKFENPWLFIGDMFELGEYSLVEHQKIIELLIEKGFTNVCLLGNDFAKTTNNVFLKFSDTEAAVKYLTDNPVINCNILIKGSRGMKMEDLLKVL